MHEICRKSCRRHGKCLRCGVVHTFSDMDITTEAYSIDNESRLFNRLDKECPGAIPNLITHKQYNQRRKKTMKLG